MKKKVLAGILAATMAFSMAACGSTGSSSDSGSSAASGSTAKTEEKGEPYTVTMVLQGSQQQDEERIEEKINEILEPELNAKLDIVVLPWASASQQLQLMLSGDEKIDLLYTNATTAVQYMHSGQIMDMSELIDKYGTNLKDIYGEDIAKTNQIDGFVYGVPNQIERGSIPAIFMRKDLVEKYNINTDEIKEPKDMEKVFETVQAGEPDMTMLFSSNNSMKKKVLAGILAATMAFSMAACGSTGSSSDSGSSAASGSTAKTEEKGEPYTVTMVLQGSQQQDEERIEEKINEILEPELNAKLDIVVLPWASASQQLQLMLSGDEKIDLLYTNATTAVQYMHSGQIMDMSELIDKYGTNLKDIYGEDIAKTNQIDGFVYGVPNQIERGSIPAIFMRKDLVEKYNINTDEIKEPKDMEKVFETVQAGEPDMTMLFSSNNSDTPLSRLSRADGLGDANTGALMDQTNSTTVENYFASDWYKETATMLHDWYQKGYISKDAGTNTENWRTVCKAGNLFSLFFAYHPGTPVEFQSSTGYEFEIVPFYDQPIINSSSYGGIIFSVAQNSENPEKAMQVLDYIYGSPEVMNLLNWGEEGTDYVVEDEENGIINYPDGVTADNAGYSFNCGWELPNQFIAYKWDGSDPQLWDKMQEFNASGIESKALGFVFDNSEYADQVSALNNVISQYNGALSSGSGDPEELLPQFLEALDDAGIDDVIAAKQEQLDAFLAKK